MWGPEAEVVSSLEVSNSWRSRKKRRMRVKYRCRPCLAYPSVNGVAVMKHEIEMMMMMMMMMVLLVVTFDGDTDDEHVDEDEAG